MRSGSRRDFVGSLAGASLLAFAKTAQAKESIPLPRSIFLAPNASLSEKWAARDLSVHLEKMTGRAVPIVTSDTVPNPPVIAVGRSAATDRYGLEIPETESCLLKTEGGTLILAGGRQRGTMYGVYSFLEKLGCRWFTADVANIPAKRDLSLPPLNEIIRPAFDYREVFFTEAQGKEWSARNRLNGHFHQLDDSVGGKISYLPFAHSFYDLIPPDRYFATHPEYFALVAGQRRGKNAQLCLTNANVVDIAAEGVRKWLNENSNVSIVSVSQNDGAGWCECDPCQTIVRSEGGAVSGVLLGFVNQIAQRVAPSHPDKIIDTLAYQNSADPPAMVKPASNVQIRLCPIDSCQAHSYPACVYNRTFEEQLAGWARIAPKLVVWQYSINFAHFLLPFPNEQQLISDIRRFRRAGVSGMFIEGAVSEGGGGENAELRSYLAARLLWNPETDVNAETHGFLNAVYGPAAPFMRRYYALRQKEIRPSEHLWIDQNVEASYLTRHFLSEGRELLNRAHSKAQAGAPRRRIERCALSLDYIDVMRRRKCRVQGATYGPENLEKVKLDTQSFVERAESLGMTHLREGYPLQAQAEAFEKFANAYPVLALENGTLSLQVVPDLGARIIALCFSPGASNLLRVPDPGEFAYPFAGGLHFSLTSDYSSNLQQDVLWHAGPVENGSVSLHGKSELGFEVEMRIQIASGVLQVRFTATNRAANSFPVALRCQAEFAMAATGGASLSYSSGSGIERVQEIERGKHPSDGNITLSGDERPHEQWTLATSKSAPKIRNCFHDEEVGRCGIRWSVRSGPRVSMILWSPEVTLAAGQTLSMETHYELV